MKSFTKHTYDSSGRTYNFDDGSTYFSVTTALGATKDMRFLNDWRKKVGSAKAESITKTATNIGNDVHRCMEHYLLGDDVVYPNSFVKMLCRQIIPYIDKHVSKVYYTEEVLYSDSLQLAGTADGIVDYMNHGMVLDFKTSKRVPKISWITDYFLQMYIYSVMIEEMYGMKMKKGVLLFCFKEQRSRNNQIVVDLSKYKDVAMRRIELFHKSTNRENGINNDFY